MSLTEYARKRSFDKTPEPGPGAPTLSPEFRFCVQRHSARRLHYDLRMEIGGTLKSWAVPEGPTLDPNIKRLAVMVEDHPMEYASFEGNIPKGNYGAGSMMLWDAGVFDVLMAMPAEQQLERGDFKFRLNGRKLHGEFALVRLKNSAKGNEWLLLKKKDASAQIGWDGERFAYSVLSGRTQEEIAMNVASRIPAKRDLMPIDITPMLATAASEPPAAPGWWYEIKWDGVRALCYIENGVVHLRGRKGSSFDRQYVELLDLHRYIAADTALIDGEIVAFDEAGRPSFHRLQPRIMATQASQVADLMRARPVTFYAFDLLYLDGRDLRGEPLSERKKLLEAIIRPSPVVKLSTHFESNGAGLLEAARAQGLEGIVAKRADSRYAHTRGRDWVKVKIVEEQEFALCGYTTGNRDYFSALIVGTFEDGVLTWAGNVGTGFDRKTMEQILELVTPLETAKCPFAAAPKMDDTAHWIRPELVCTVRYQNLTGDGKLRAPVYVGMRTDIAPEDCTLDGAAPAADAPAQRPQLLPPGRAEMAVTIDGQPMRFKNLDKIYYPEDGLVKRDLLNYYDAVAELLIPHWKDRPLSLRRYPDGIHGEGFFQKNAGRVHRDG